MARSARFRQLERDLRELRLHFLPRRFNRLGLYAARVHSRAAAYRVLAHAEIEAYFEDRSLEVVRTALDNWKKKSTVSRTLMCLLGYAGRHMDEPPPTVKPEQPTQADVWELRLRLSRKVNEAAKVYYAAVKANHGVKESNILRLLLPLGIDSDTLDQVWLASMNTFGEQRGEAAHTSRSSWKLKQLPDPETELKVVMDLVPQIKEVDEHLNEILKRC